MARLSASMQSLIEFKPRACHCIACQELNRQDLAALFIKHRTISLRHGYEAMDLIEIQLQVEATFKHLAAMPLEKTKNEPAWEILWHAHEDFACQTRSWLNKINEKGDYWWNPETNELILRNFTVIPGLSHKVHMASIAKVYHGCEDTVTKICNLDDIATVAHKEYRHWRKVFGKAVKWAKEATGLTEMKGITFEELDQSTNAEFDRYQREFRDLWMDSLACLDGTQSRPRHRELLPFAEEDAAAEETSPSTPGIPTPSSSPESVRAFSHVPATTHDEVVAWITANADQVMEEARRIRERQISGEETDLDRKVMTGPSREELESVLKNFGRHCEQME